MPGAERDAASLDALASNHAESLCDQLAAFVRKQDAIVEAAIEHARPVRREKRLAAIIGNATLQRDPRIGNKYQIDVMPLTHWVAPAADEGDEHTPPTLVPTDPRRRRTFAQCQ